MALSRALIFALAASAAAQPSKSLRRDGVPVRRPAPGALRREFAASSLSDFPFKKFSAKFVAKAKSSPTNWTARGAVTPVKDQGEHGYCGTFGRVAAAEGQFALKAGHGLVSFSEEELVDW